MEPKYFPVTESFSDDRGKIWTSFDMSKDLFPVNHVKFSTNKSGVFRGFHADKSTYKLATCISGSIIAFVVWPDNKKYEAYLLSSENNSRLIIPPGYFNGFLCLMDSVYCYHLGYKGSYIDADKQFTLTLEESCIPLDLVTKHFPISDLIRSRRDYEN